MRATASIRLLLVPAALFAAGCNDSSLPQEPPTLEEAIPVQGSKEPALAGATRWADGYLHAGSPTTASYAPLPYLSYNRSGGAMKIRKPAGTTGRYVVTFSGLSAVLGTRNTVHVTEYGLNDTYCKPVNARLVADTLEVRCFRASTRAPANAAFTVVVLSPEANNTAFAYAHQPTSTGYSAAAAATYNPGGATRVSRSSVGVYRVTFTNLAKAIPSGVSGHVQVNAVGTGKAHCTVEDWGTPDGADLNVSVECYSPAGALVDSKFNLFYLLSSAHVAYAYAHEPSAPSYSPQPSLRWNPSGGAVTITRTGVGDYTVVWEGVDAAIVDGGTVQVTAASQAGTQCKATSLFDSGVIVHCFGPNGMPRDAAYMVLLGS